MDTRATDCLFCARREWVLWRGEHLFLQLDDAPLTEGHGLICTRRHYPSLADAPAVVAAALDELVEMLREIYVGEYGSFALFEHGRTGHCTSRGRIERMCDHAHVHVLPLEADLVASMTGQRAPCTGWGDVRALAADLEGYVIVQDAGAPLTLFPILGGLPPHFMRTKAAMLLGDPARANWEVVMNDSTSVSMREAAFERLRSLRSVAAKLAILG